jgi:hypothetical protein
MPGGRYGVRLKERFKDFVAYLFEIDENGDVTSFFAAGCFYSRCQGSPSVSDGTSELIPMKRKPDADEIFF